MQVHPNYLLAALLVSFSCVSLQADEPQSIDRPTTGIGLSRRSTPTLVCCIADYSLNDRKVGLEVSETAWRSMIGDAQKAGVPVVLMTPTPDSNEDIKDERVDLAMHAGQVRRIGHEMNAPVVDSYAAFRSLILGGDDVGEFLSQPNHPNRKGHEVVAKLILELF